LFPNLFISDFDLRCTQIKNFSSKKTMRAFSLFHHFAFRVLVKVV
jgi:hypothetical protein